MQEEGLMDEALLEEYLEYCHDIPLHLHISPDPELRQMLQAITLPKWVFTAGRLHLQAPRSDLSPLHRVSHTCECHVWVRRPPQTFQGCDCQDMIRRR